MEFEKKLDEKAEKQTITKSEMPKHKQLIKMLTFRVVPAYYKEIEKVADHKKMSVSKLIRSYIKDGMKRDNELTNQEDKDFRVE
jgi:predicted HicB family RNase H-like nuclease